MVTILNTTRGPIERIHHPAPTHNRETAICSVCEQGWPCEVAQLLKANAQLRDALRLMAQKVHGAHGGRGSCHWCGEPCCDDARRLLREHGEA